ncbi:unnamed protein product [Paramecium primaurelia]|uniref:Uncharacterized protein n=1 Tax=Paramecium primaurelia TaxID=5886 RepID=A0A8S1Q168_PARPR|nr:unnamed protein product [Paramecium primaurelia]
MNQQQQNNKQNMNSRSFKYSIRNGKKIKLKTWCNAIAINHNNTFMIVASDRNILVFQFKLDKSNSSLQFEIIQKIQLLQIFLNIRSQDNSIIICSLNLPSNTKYIAKLNTNPSIISSLLIHPSQEDLIICSSQNIINFWSSSSISSIMSLSLLQTINHHTDYRIITKLRGHNINILCLGQNYFDIGRIQCNLIENQIIDTNLEL